VTYRRSRGPLCGCRRGSSFAARFGCFALAPFFLRGFAGFRSAALQFFGGIHRPAAVGGGAVAGAGVVAAFVEAVVVGDLGVGWDVPQGGDPDVAVFVFAGLAVAIATVVDEHGGAEAVDDNRAVAQSKEIGDGVVGVKLIGFFFADAAAGVFGNALALADKRSGVATGGVDG
jgi:hypothetical protein